VSLRSGGCPPIKLKEVLALFSFASREKMNYVYNKIPYLKYKGFDLYYRSEIDNKAHPATVFNDKYEYFYKSPYKDEIKSLGKFKGISKRSSNLRYNDYDYDVYEFAKEEVSLEESRNIFSRGIGECGENMVRLEGDGLFRYGVGCIIGM